MAKQSDFNKFLSNIEPSYNTLIVNNKKVYNHIAYTNVSDTFWGRKYEVNQADICDYLKKWRFYCFYCNICLYLQM